MSELTEPRRRALQNVEEDSVYLQKLGMTRKTWMLDGVRQPLRSQPYDWLLARGYIKVIDHPVVGRVSVHITPTGQAALDTLLRPPRDEAVAAHDAGATA